MPIDSLFHLVRVKIVEANNAQTSKINLLSFVRSIRPEVKPAKSRIRISERYYGSRMFFDLGICSRICNRGTINNSR